MNIKTVKMIKPATRLNSAKEYYFSKKLREVRALIAEGKPIINLGIGSPDLSPPESAVKALNQAMLMDGTHQYQPYKGIPELRQAMARFYEKHYGVTLNPENQILPLTGSKEGIMHISMAFLNKGDQVLVPNPGYPTYKAVTQLLEAQPVFYNLDAANNWMPDLENISKRDLSKVKIMWVNYPHMPSGTTPSKGVFKELVAFAKAHEIIVVNDNPYSFILNEHPESFLKEVAESDPCLELNSLSKTFNMAGWRIGILGGNPALIEHVVTVKSNMDSGMFYGLQKGAIAALTAHSEWFNTLNEVYKKRREWAWKIADALNASYHKDTAGLFVWAKLPDQKSSTDVSDALLYDYHIFITPGFIFGSQGSDYIRISLCVPESELETAYKRLSNFK